MAVVRKLRISHPSGKIRAKIQLPGSKSESNRLLLLQKLFFPQLEIKQLSDSKDSRVMQEALTAQTATVNVGDAGTAMRFMTAYLAVQEGRECEIRGTARMHQRPIGHLVEALRELGADIEYLAQEGYPPLKIRGKKLKGGKVSIDGSLSSQYVSALMMIAPALEEGLILRLKGFSVSAPYIYLTANIMERLGFRLSIKGELISVAALIPKAPPLYTIEADWSAASYWYLQALLADQAELYLPSLRELSFQGDAALRGMFEKLGVTSHFIGSGYRVHKSDGARPTSLQLNLVETPDLAQTLVVGCAAAGLPAHFKGLQTLRIKETDRLLALKTELEKGGAQIEIGEDFLRVEAGLQSIRGLEFETYQDHRMAMALAPLALHEEIIVKDPGVVEKSYPHFWQHLESAGYQLTPD